jgi:hypothetical protein
MSGPALANTRSLLGRLPEPCELLLVDVEARPDLARAAKVTFTPTLEFQTPTRRRRVLGDFADEPWTREHLGLEAGGPAAAPYTPAR